MNSFEDIQQLWQQPDTNDIPEIGQAIAAMKKKRSAMLLKNAGLTLLLLLTAIFILLLLFHYEFKMITTTIGIVLGVVALAAAMIVNTNLFTILMKQADDAGDNSQYLASLKKYQQRMRFIHTKGISIYFALLGAGIMLYMFEFLQNNLWTLIAGYALTLGWIGFVWFYIRPRTISKQSAEIESMISRLENISQQLKC
ncbi:hypothetical protein HHL16_23470 [Pseudoflavitalea sp. G-6-1-2]|uniref:hypothetical protein n=1 Tax=Pseudoflavitalea sp. G-6-1-2 TaxID=2728841 RepID=UPI00146C9556|nr:hypothetical protein [Pseudoflavitalea sp. G-6-1-2]NML23860.1 hypothetical protein [Pseudoflavitalea sp. G-6-1-2]